jgi:hypothetical protein
MTRSMLTDSLIFGTTIELRVYNPSTQLFFLRSGRVTGLSLESGSEPGKSARNFMVKFYSEAAMQSYETYVQTID